MNLWRSLEGQEVLMLTAADLPKAMQTISAAGIEICHSEPVDDLTIRLTVKRADVTILKKIIQKRGDRFTVIGRNGLYWVLRSAAARPVLLAACLLLVLITVLLPGRILFVRVEGNTTLPTRQILAAAEESGIRFGASRRAVRSEKVKNTLLEQIPQLQWAGVNTKGCVATVSVRERSLERSDSQTKDVSSIVAVREGIILSCTVTAGTGHCVPGQAVRRGQMLISGYTDCGLMIRATRAEGEVMAQTRRQLSVASLCSRKVRLAVTKESRQYSLIIGKKRINFTNSSRICDATCGRMYEEYYITLPGGFVLPVALAVQTLICSETVSSVLPQENAEQKLMTFARSYLQNQMISGTVVKESFRFQSGKEICRLDADCLCREMIGKRVQERKVEMNGESD